MRDAEYDPPDWMNSYTIVIDREELWLNGRPHSHKRIVNKSSVESIAGHLGCSVGYLTKVAQHWADRMEWPTHSYTDRGIGPDDVNLELERPLKFAEVVVMLTCETLSIAGPNSPDRILVGNSWSTWPENNQS